MDSKSSVASEMTPLALLIQLLCNRLTHIAPRGPLQQAYDFTEYEGLLCYSVFFTDAMCLAPLLAWFRMWTQRHLKLLSIMLWHLECLHAFCCGHT